MQLSLWPIRGASHKERLENFYRNQAGSYDTFRRRLLHGRHELVESLPMSEGNVWCDMGAGTGENVEYAARYLSRLRRVYLVDLCPSLLQLARERIAARSWRNVEVVEADAETFRPAGASVDLVTFSYSLSMIPDWIAALENAWQLLRPGGYLGVVDFYVSRKFPPGELMRHSWLTRTWWPTWFGMDNVYLRSDVLPYVLRRYQPMRLNECRGKVPFLCGASVPYFVFVGRKPACSDSAKVP